MSRNFTSEQTLIDQLLLDDTSAFEELHHRYCVPLYSYCIAKLDSPEDAKRIIRDIFIALWEQRHSLPVDFSISVYLYTEVRKAVIKCVDERLLDQHAALSVEKQIIPGFAVMQLKQARKPVQAAYKHSSNYHSPAINEGNYENQWWSKYVLYINLKGLRHAFQSIMNFW